LEIKLWKDKETGNHYHERGDFVGEENCEQVKWRCAAASDDGMLLVSTENQIYFVGE